MEVLVIVMVSLPCVFPTFSTLSLIVIFYAAKYFFEARWSLFCAESAIKSPSIIFSTKIIRDTYCWW